MTGSEQRRQLGLGNKYGSIAAVTVRIRKGEHPVRHFIRHGGVKSLSLDFTALYTGLSNSEFVAQMVVALNLFEFDCDHDF